MSSKPLGSATKKCGLRLYLLKIMGHCRSVQQWFWRLSIHQTKQLCLETVCRFFFFFWAKCRFWNTKRLSDKTNVNVLNNNRWLFICQKFIYCLYVYIYIYMYTYICFACFWDNVKREGVMRGYMRWLSLLSFDTTPIYRREGRLMTRYFYNNYIKWRDI